LKENAMRLLSGSVSKACLLRTCEKSAKFVMKSQTKASAFH
jgi:hypothetical protein